MNMLKQLMAGMMVMAAMVTLAANRTVVVSDSEEIAIFDEVGTFDFRLPDNATGVARLLVVGGGGAGGGNSGGGGGGGQYVYYPEYSLVPGTTYSCTVADGGSAVEFYTEGGYMSGDIDFCRKTLKSVPPRIMQEVAESLGGKGLGRNWLICGLYVDILGLLESETLLPERVVDTPYGELRILPPELVLVERILYAEQDAECIPSARQMMAACLKDSRFDWAEAERLAALPDFKVSMRLAELKKELSDA